MSASQAVRKNGDLPARDGGLRLRVDEADSGKMYQRTQRKSNAKRSKRRAWTERKQK
jgi:hypothetical protein